MVAIFLRTLQTFLLDIRFLEFLKIILILYLTVTLTPHCRALYIIILGNFYMWIYLNISINEYFQMIFFCPIKVWILIFKNNEVCEKNIIKTVLKNCNDLKKIILLRILHRRHRVELTVHTIIVQCTHCILYCSVHTLYQGYNARKVNSGLPIIL